MATRSTVQFCHIGQKTIKTFSYVVTLCRKGSDEVKAVRLDGYKSKYDRDFKEDLEGNFPESQWTVKSILKLHDSDFEGGQP